MSYILDLMKGAIEPPPDRITLNRYVQESSYITKYLSRVVKDKALAVYHVQGRDHCSLGAGRLIYRG
jgi:hypothetical protein